jgi:hypothetical protein
MALPADSMSSSLHGNRGWAFLDNATNGFELIRGRSWKPSLDDVDVKPHQLPGDLDFILNRQRRSRRLFPIP